MTVLPPVAAPPVRFPWPGRQRWQRRNAGGDEGSKPMEVSLYSSVPEKCRIRTNPRCDKNLCTVHVILSRFLLRLWLWFRVTYRNYGNCHHTVLAIDLPHRVQDSAMSDLVHN